MAETASLLDSWESEVQAAWLYLVLAEVETGENKRLFKALSADALEQSKAWVKAIEEAGGPAPGPYEAPFRVRLVGTLIRRIGPRSLLPALAALKVRGLSVYRAAPSSLEVLIAQEAGSSDRMESRDHLLGEEQRHLYTRGAVALHAAIFGANDGLVSNTALILAASGAGASPGTALPHRRRRDGRGGGVDGHRGVPRGAFADRTLRAPDRARGGGTAALPGR